MTRELARRRTTSVQDWAMLLSASPNPGDLPLYLQVSRAVAERIRAGKLASGARLPGSRSLALALGLHRNTVLKAYDELMSEGWIETTHAKGTFVSRAIPEEQAVAPAKPAAPFPFVLPKSRVAEVARQDSTPGCVQLYGGSADLRLLPSTAIARAYRRALRHAPRLLAYGDAQGSAPLRAELCRFLSASRGMTVSPDQILITRGSQMGLYLAAAAMLRPRDIVVVEAMGYPPAWESLRATGAELVGCRIDGQGLDVERLERLCEQQRRKRRPVRVVYLTPHHHYPTTVTLAPGRRMTLGKLAVEYGFVVIEDDYDHEFHYDGQPTLPLASAMPERVVYAGTLSKVLAPGFRLGFLVAPPAVVQRATTLRFYIDRQGDAASEAALAELFEDGEIARHIRKTRWVYQERRDHCVKLLRQTFGDELEFAVPTGGMALWIRSRRAPVTAWLDESRKLGVEFQVGRGFALRPLPDEYARLGFAAVTPAEMEAAVERLARAWQRVAR